jgi:mRNA-degrading endonuclease RelE of RelBE toxin-antitoxin system
MYFRIAVSFNDSLSRLTADQQKQVKLTVYDLQADPSNPGHKFHKLGKAKDPKFWSVRVSSDIRLIVHHIDSSLLVCYVDHHDKAYTAPSVGSLLRIQRQVPLRSSKDERPSRQSSSGSTSTHPRSLCVKR